MMLGSAVIRPIGSLRAIVVHSPSAPNNKNSNSRQSAAAFTSPLVLQTITHTYLLQTLKFKIQTRSFTETIN